MKVGDLVRYKDGDLPTWLGYIVSEIPGWSQVKVVEWWNPTGTKMRSSHPAANLEVASEGR